MVTWISFEDLQGAGRTLDDLAEGEWVLMHSDREPLNTAFYSDWADWVSRDTIVTMPWRRRNIDVTSPIEMAECWNREVAGKAPDSWLATIKPRK